MGTYHYAKLIYGYDIGNSETPMIEQVEDYSVTTPWFKRDEDGWVDEDLDVAVIRRLYEALPGDEAADTWGQRRVVEDRYGVVIEDHGYGSEAQSQYALSVFGYNVEGGESEVIDPELLVEMRAYLDEKLDRVMAVLTDFTPTTKRGWTLLADR